MHRPLWYQTLGIHKQHWNTAAFCGCRYCLGLPLVLNSFKTDLSSGASILGLEKWALDGVRSVWPFVSRWVIQQSYLHCLFVFEMKFMLASLETETKEENIYTILTPMSFKHYLVSVTPLALRLAWLKEFIGYIFIVCLLCVPVPGRCACQYNVFWPVKDEHEYLLCLLAHIVLGEALGGRVRSLHGRFSKLLAQ
jgi:hypothetical protein